MGTVFTHPAEGLYLCPLQQEERRGIAAAEGFHTLQHCKGFGRPGPEGDNHVIFHGGQEAFLRCGGGDHFFQPFLKQGNVLCFYGQAGSLFVSAEALQQVGTGGKHAVDIHSGNGSAGTDGGVLMNAEGNGGQVKAFTQPPGSKADETRIPVFSGYDDDMGFCQFRRIQLGQGGGCHFPLQVLPGAVGFLQQARNMRRLGGVRGQEQMNAQLGVSQPSGSVQPGTETERKIIGSDRCLQSGVFQQGFQAGAGGVHDAVKPFPDNHPVFSLQGHDIRHGGQGGQIQPLFHARHSLKGLADFKRHTRAAQIRAGIISQQGIHHHIRLRKYFRRLVMIGDDNCQPKGLCQGNFFHIGDTAVHRDEYLGLFRNFTDGIGIEAIAFGMTGRNAVCQGGAFLVQGFHQDGGGTDAIRVIVAVYENGFPFSNGLPEQGDCFGHAGKQEGIVKIVQGRIQITMGVFFRMDTAG